MKYWERLEKVEENLGRAVELLREAVELLKQAKSIAPESYAVDIEVCEEELGKIIEAAQLTLEEVREEIEEEVSFREAES